MPLITAAFAAPATAAADSATGMVVSFMPLLIVFFIFYILVLRPQQRRMQEHRAQIAALKKGDRIITGGGVIATVTRTISDDEIAVDLGNGMEVTLMRQTIIGLREDKKA